MPAAPERMALVRARFIARLKLTRFEGCSAIDWATSTASSSGGLTSRMLTCTLLPVLAWISLRRASTSEPLLPITMPGRAVWMSMVTLFWSLRMMTRDRPAWASLRRM